MTFDLKSEPLQRSCELKSITHTITVFAPSTTKKTHISCQFCFEIFFVENTYKFCYEKKFAGNCCQFFCKIFSIKHFSQQIL